MDVPRRVGEAVVKAEYMIPPSSGGSGGDNPLDCKQNDEVGTSPTTVVIQPNGNCEMKESQGVVSVHGDENTSKAADDLCESIDTQPPRKKKKGQNKARPRTVPKQRTESRICHAVLNNEECKFGEKCRFSHNVEEYLKLKGPNIGDVCMNFSETGKCRYGIECMYSKTHITEDNRNVIDEEKYKNYCENNRNNNTLNIDVMKTVRKKKYEFPRSKTFLSKLNCKPNSTPNLDEHISNGKEDIVWNQREKKKIDFSGKLYLAPLTTVGNLPFRSICKRLGADITCGEMALSTKLLQCHQAEWALIRRHPSEDIFGVQICGAFPDTMAKITELLSNEFNIDFIDINMGCPIDLICNKGEGSALMNRLSKLEQIVKGMVEVSDVPITIKMRTGVSVKKINAHKIVPLVKEWGVDMITMHGRTKEQRYTKEADWDYINECADLASPIPFFGNGDILSFEDANLRTKTSGIMIARGALIKPWIFTEIKEQRHLDISSNERFDLLREFTNVGLTHWGSDFKGVENTRRFLLEWLSFLYRYIPVGLLETLPQRINERAPSYYGRNDLETLFASENAADWVKISEMLLGPVPDNFTFMPKHKANSYS